MNPISAQRATGKIYAIVAADDTDAIPYSWVFEGSAPVPGISAIYNTTTTNGIPISFSSATWLRHLRHEFAIRVKCWKSVWRAYTKEKSIISAWNVGYLRRRYSFSLAGYLSLNDGWFGSFCIQIRKVSIRTHALYGRTFVGRRYEGMENWLAGAVVAADQSQSNR